MQHHIIIISHGRPGPKMFFVIFCRGFGTSWELREHVWDFWARANF